MMIMCIASITKFSAFYFIQGFLFRDKNGMPEVAPQWEHRFKHAVNRYNRGRREKKWIRQKARS